MALFAIGATVVAADRDRAPRAERPGQVKLQTQDKVADAATLQKQQAAEQNALRARLEAAAGRALSDVEFQKVVGHSKGIESRMYDLLGVPALQTDRQAFGPPANDACDAAEAVAIGDTVAGSTVGSAPDDPVGFCGTTPGTGGAVWYTVVGDGTRLRAETCNQADYDTKINIYCGGCPKLFCVTGNDDGPGCAGFTSQVDWDSEAGRTYFILVNGFLGATGTFDLTVSSVGKLAGDDPVVCKSQPEPPSLTINEIRIDQSGSDVDEYFELCGEEGEDLTDVWYLVIGDGAGGTSGVIENATPLAGSFPAGGYFLAAEDTFSLGAVPDLVTSLNFENSDNVTHLLVWQFTGMEGDDIDADDDCVLDSTPWTAVIDLIALIEDPNGGECTYGPPNVGPDGTFVPGHSGRCEDCIGSWAILNFDTINDDPPGAPGTGIDTPRASNDPECPAGSCCRADGSCQDVFDQAECDGDGDIFNAGQNCSKTACPQPPPANDECDGRIAISDGVTPFDTTWATTGAMDPVYAGCGGNEMVNSNIWFNYQATCSGLVTVSTCEELGGSATFDTRIAIHDGCACPADAGTTLVCNDDDPNNDCGTFGGGFHSTAIAPVTAGNCYKINVGGFNDAEVGPGELLIECVGDVIGACCQADGTCTEQSETDCAAAGGTYAGDATLCSTTPCNDACANRLDITDGQTPFTTLGASTDGSLDDCVNGGNGDFDGNANEDVWFNYTATCNGVLTATTCEELGGSADYDTRIQIYDGCGCPADSAPIVCNDDDPDNPCGGGGGGFHSTATVAVSSGNCYKIRVGGFNPGDEGSGVLDVSCEAAGGACCDGLTCTDVADLAECAGLGGIFQGVGTACDTTVCGGACCDGDDNCTQQVDEDACTAAGGIAFTNGATCDDVVCFQCPLDDCENLNQSASKDDGQSAVACGVAGVSTSENGFARCWDGVDRILTSATFGVSQATADGIPVDIVIYSVPTCAPPAIADAVVVHTENVIVNMADAGTLVTVSLPDVAVSGSILVEILASDGSDGGPPPAPFQFRPYANGLGECGPSYIRADACGLTDWLPNAAIGFPDSQWVLQLGTTCCGNGIVETGEECDGGDCCEADCTLTADGTVCAAGDDAACLGDATCDGASSDCPANPPAAAGTECRASAGPCDVAEECDGQNAGCPADEVEDAGTICSPGSPSACIADAVCDGSGVDCPPNQPIVMCIDGDGCCPSTCNANEDSDCVPVCGNGRLESGECCDDGNTDSGDGCDAECECEISVPTVTEWGMICLMLALLAGIAVVFGRRRRLA